MPELNSSKNNIGTVHTSSISLFSNIIFKTVIWSLVVIITLSFLISRFLPVEKIIPIPEINQVIYEKTGLEVKITGKTRLSILPFFGITARDVVITNPSFEEKNVLSAKEIDIKIAIFPLLIKRLVIKNIILDNASIDIIKCENAYNFFTPPISNSQPAKTQENQKRFFNFRNTSLTHLKISNSRFSYKSCKTDIIHKITEINAKISAPNSDAKIKANISINLNNHKLNLKLRSSSLNDLLKENKGAIDIIIKSELGDITADAKYKINKNNPILFDAFNLNIAAKNLSGEKLAKQTQNTNTMLRNLPPIDFSLGAELKNHKLSVSRFVVNSKHLAIKSKNISGTISENPLLSNINGSLEITFSDLNNFCNTFEIPTQSFTNLPQKITSQIDFTLEKGMFNTHKTSYIKFDDTNINIASLVSFIPENRFINFDITADKLNIDHYLAKNPEVQDAQKNIQGIQKNIHDSPIHIPQISKIPVESRISIDSLVYKNVNFEDLTSIIKINNNSTTLKAQTNAFDGKISLEGGITQRDGVLQTVSSNIIAKKVEINDILKYLNQEAKFSGISTFQINISANGSTGLELTKQNSGTITFDSTNSTLHGIAIDSLIFDIKNDYKQIFSGSIKEKYFSPSGKSKIDSIAARVILKNGVLINEKFTIKTNSLSFNISGEMNIINHNIHYTVSPIHGSSPLPSLVLNGTTNDILYSIDASSYIKQSAKSFAEKEFSSQTTQEKLKKLKNLFNNLKK